MVDILPLKMLRDRVPNPDGLVYCMFCDYFYHGGIIIFDHFIEYRSGTFFWRVKAAGL
jgi:hypothetical protein